MRFVLLLSTSRARRAGKSRKPAPFFPIAAIVAVSTPGDGSSTPKRVAFLHHVSICKVCLLGSIQGTRLGYPIGVYPDELSDSVKRIGGVKFLAAADVRAK